MYYQGASAGGLNSSVSVRIKAGAEVIGAGGTSSLLLKGTFGVGPGAEN